MSVLDQSVTDSLKRPLKSSMQVSLVLLGGTLVACSNDPYQGQVRKPSKGETRYDYRNRDDCVKDWGQVCPPQSQGSLTGAGTGLYHYYRREDKAKSKNQTRAVNVKRGGFGGRASSGS